MARTLRTTDIVRFIDELPGGSVPQYSRLMAVSPIRINKILGEDTQGQRLVLQGKVCAPIKGKIPKWATTKTQRGELDGHNLKDLPSYVNNLLESMHPNYRDDGMFLFKTLIEMASGRKNFESGVTDLTEMYSELGHHVVQVEGQLESRAKALHLLEQENNFWKRNMRDMARDNNIELPPLMEAELQIADRRHSSVAAPEADTEAA